MKLIIVESPAKIAKIKSFLGEGWRVEASTGHVRDLPQHDLGIIIADSFRTVYEIVKSKQNIVRRLMKAIKDADEVYLATDPDREGEAIAWHLLELARLPKKKPVYRVTFNAITKAAVQAAIAAPRQLDGNLVEAQQTRRVIDRLVGYMASSMVSRGLGGKFSAGRVQSVSLRLVVERERDIRAFVPEHYATLSATLKTVGGTFQAKLDTIKGQPVERLTTEQVDGLLRNLKAPVFWVGKVTSSEQSRRPAPPFTTSSLQQAASIALGLSPDATMQLAQKLYEDGAITYMRTDSVEVAPEAQQAARAYIGKSIGPDYVPAAPQVYQSRAANAQEAHEAIRPVDVALTPQALSEGPEADLYLLIWQRFLASQMADARYAHTSAQIAIGRELGQSYPLAFAASGRTCLFEGFLKLYQAVTDEDDVSENDTALPALVENSLLQFVEWLKQEHTTKAPPRYSEASLVKALEQRGIGRPSTFASMVKLIKDKGYVGLEKKRLVPTQTGMVLCAFLVGQFPRIFEFDYTATLEAELDRIASGDATRLGVLITFWGDFEPALKAVGKVVEQKLISRATVKPTGELCPRCGKPLVERQSARGPFAGCSGYPTCKFTADMAQVASTVKV